MTTEAHRSDRTPTAGADAEAVPYVVTALGLVAALAGVEHGVGELTQPGTSTGSVFIESWPHVDAFAPLGGEPAMTLIPHLDVSGLVTVVVSVVLGWCAVRARARRRDGWLLLGLSALLLVVGGGFGPPLVAALLGLTVVRAARTPQAGRPPGPAVQALGERWRHLLAFTVAAFLALVPGVVLLRWWTGLDSWWASALLPPAAFTGLVLTLVAALGHDRSPATTGAGDRSHQVEG